MTTTINASTTGGGGLIESADASGILALQTNGTTAVTIDASQNVSFAKGFTVGTTASPAFSAYMTSSQTITSSVSTKAAFNLKEFDTNSNYDTSAYRFTPTIAGYYQVNASYRYDASTVPSRAIISIYKNGSEFKRGNDIGNNSTEGVASALIYCNGTTDFIELYAYIVATVAVIGSASAALSYFQASMVRSA